MRPTLVVISGPAGTGKTTLAHELAREVGCPAVCRDEIKEGMVHARLKGGASFDAGPGDELTRRTFPAFFAVLGLLLENGVTVVAEAAFQHHVWAPSLEPLAELADLRVVQCHADPAVARDRIARRPRRVAHADGALLAALAAGDGYFDDFRRLTVGGPRLDVDTSSGYEPALTSIVAFVDG